MEWVDNHYGGNVHFDLGGVELSIAAQSAQWGADQELEAILGLMKTLNIRGVDYIRNVRRPKPPTLKEQSLRELSDAYDSGKIDDTTYVTIRRALEGIDD